MPFSPSQWDPSPFPSALLLWTRASLSPHAHRLSGESQMLLFSVLFPRLLLIQTSLHFQRDAPAQTRKALCISLQTKLFYVAILILVLSAVLSFFHVAQFLILRSLKASLPGWWGGAALKSACCLHRWPDFHSRDSTGGDERELTPWSCPLTSTCEPPQTSLHPPPHTNNKSMFFF